MSIFVVAFVEIPVLHREYIENNRTRNKKDDHDYLIGNFETKVNNSVCAARRRSPPPNILPRHFNWAGKLAEHETKCALLTRY